MKKRCLFFLLTGLILISAACGGDWSLKYDRTLEQGGFEFGLDTQGAKAFAASYLWDGSDAGRRITVPDTVEGCTVFKLGGYYGRGLPMPFCIVVPADETAPSVKGESKAAEAETPGRTEEVLFTLVFGPYLTKIENIRESADYAVYEADGTRVTYHPVFAFEVDEKNPAFYAKDRKLYRKQSGELVTDFEYPAEK